MVKKEPKKEMLHFTFICLVALAKSMLCSCKLGTLRFASTLSCEVQFKNHLNTFILLYRIFDKVKCFNLSCLFIKNRNKIKAQTQIIFAIRSRLRHRLSLPSTMPYIDTSGVHSEKLSLAFLMVNLCCQKIERKFVSLGATILGLHGAQQR